MNEDDSNVNEDVPVPSDNQADEFASSGEENEEIGLTITISSRISRPHDCSRYFLETANFQEGTQDEEGRWIIPLYFDDEEMTENLSDVTHYRDLCFIEDAQVAELSY